MSEQETEKDQIPASLPPEVLAETYLNDALLVLKEGRPNDRSARDRDFAIVITEIEKARAILRGFLRGG